MTEKEREKKMVRRVRRVGHKHQSDIIPLAARTWWGWTDVHRGTSTEPEFGRSDAPTAGSPGGTPSHRPEPWLDRHNNKYIGVLNPTKMTLWTHVVFCIQYFNRYSPLTVIFPLELLLNLLRVGTIRAHKSQQPLLQVGRGAETKRAHRCYSNETGNQSQSRLLMVGSFILANVTVAA